MRKNLKVLLTFILITASILTLSGCNEPLTEGTTLEGVNVRKVLNADEDEYSKDDISFIRLDTEDTISLGQPRSEIEEVTGAPISEENSIVQYDGISVKYDSSDCACKFSLSADMGKVYATSRGVVPNSLVVDLKLAYGGDVDEIELEAEYEDQEILEPDSLKRDTSAMRYFTLESPDSRKGEYLGSKLGETNTPEDKSTLYILQFIFDDAGEYVDRIDVGMWYGMVERSR